MFKDISFWAYADKVQLAIEHLIGLDAKGRYFRILEDGTKAFVEVVNTRKNLTAAIFFNGKLITADDQGNLTSIDPDFFTDANLGSIGPFRLLVPANDKLYVVDKKGNLGEVKLPRL